MKEAAYIPVECPYCATLHNVDMRVMDGSKGLSFLGLTCVNCKMSFKERLLCATESDGTRRVTILRTVRPAWIKKLTNLTAMSNGRLNRNIAEHSRISEPPKFGEYLIYLFLSRQDRVNILGDLMEDYGTIESKFGRPAAVFWYYKQVVASIPPCVWKRLFKWGTITAIGDWFRRHI